MGCGNSKNKINSASTPRAPTSKPPSANKTRRPNSKTIKVKSKEEDQIHQEEQGIRTRSAKKKSRKDKNRQWGSQDSLDSTHSNDDGTRGWSASSKFSTHSGDSGFGGGGGGDLNNVITEESHPDTIKEIEDEFNTPRGLDLGITGSAVRQRSSAKDKDRMEEQRVMAALREEGLIQRPMSRAANGMSFEIIATDPGAGDYMFGAGIGAPKRPARLEKLEQRRKKKRAPKTEEEIRAKLDRAERRRKEAEQQRLDKIASLNKSDVLSALDSFAKSQVDKEEQVETKLDHAAENREKRLQEQRDKLRAKKEHAERVRRRKAMNPTIEESPRDDTPVPQITDDTPVGGKSSLRADRLREQVRQFDDMPVGVGASGEY